MARETHLSCYICKETYIDKRVNKFRREPLPVELNGRPFTIYINILGG